MTISLNHWDQSLQVPSRPSIWRWIASGIALLLDGLEARAARRRSLVHLAEMPEWQLHDIGLTRAQVDRALHREGVARDLVQPNQPH